MKRLRPKVVRLKKPAVPDDTQFIETLVWVLSEARKGNVLGYAGVFIVDGVEARRSIEVGCVKDDDNSNRHALELLGLMHCMERNFITRNWPEHSAV